MPSAPAVRSPADFAAAAAAAARAVPGVSQASASTRSRRRILRRAPAPAGTGGNEASGDDRFPPAVLDGGPWTTPQGAPATLVDALLRAAEGDRGTTFVLADGSERRQSYRLLLSDSRHVLSGLRAAGLVPGDSVLVHCADNRNFVTGFWACLLGGFVPTPIGVAPTYRWENAVTRRLRGVRELLNGAPILTDAALVDQIAGLRALWDEPDLTVLAVEHLHAGPAAEPHQAAPDDPAVHLLTSGSTGVPKCVRHSHRTVVNRAYINVAANGFGPEEVTLNFMPLDHVAGMVMHNLRDVIMRWEHVNARTDSFIADPLRWLDWLDRYRVTNTSAPNFVISLVTGLAADIERRSWDLSTVRDITNGGEAIVGPTTQDFLRLLAPYGLAPDVMRPAWGMSEMCGGMVHSTLRADREPTGVLTIDAATLGGTLAPLPGPAPGHPTFAEVGVPIPGTAVRIVDATGQVVPENRIGRLQTRGATTMVGYHNNPTANAEAFTDDGWFVTGDLAFVHGGRLVITGREKEVVVRSANYSCHEIESVVERVDGVLPTFVAAGSEHDPDTGTDELVVLCVLDEAGERRPDTVIGKIRTRLAREVGLLPRVVVPVPQAAFPKSSAGKIERARLLAEYQAGAFDDALAALDDAGPGAPSDAVEDDEPSWTFGLTWPPVPAAPGAAPPGPWVVLDDGDLGVRLAARADGTVVSVLPGEAFGRDSAGRYRMDPADPAHYRALLTAVRADYGSPGAVVHAWAAGAPESSQATALDRSARSLHHTIAALAADRPELCVITTNALATPGDPVDPVRATVTGLVRTANAEAGGRWVRQLDFGGEHCDRAGAVLAALADGGADAVIAHRGERRLAPRLSPLPDPRGVPAHTIRRGGLYLLTGGLGGIGVPLARYLLTEYGARLVLTGRSEPTGERAARLADLAALGEVTYRRVDVTDLAAMRAVVTDAEQHHGRALDGLVHLAGAGFGHYWRDLSAHLLTEEDPGEFERMRAAKIAGTEVVGEVLRNRPDALMVLFSSVNGHFGGTAFGAYASASGFLPAFAARWRALGRPVQCQSWSRWTTGPDSDAGLDALRRHGYRAIDPERGVRLFAAALADPAAHVLIGLDEDNEYISAELDPAVSRQFQVAVSYRGDVPEERVRAAVTAAIGPGVAVRADREPETPVQPEPDATVQRDPEIEVAVAAIWRVTLRLPSLGHQDHFFDRGGNSLMAMRLVDRVNVAFNIDLSVQDLYDHPTVESLASAIDRVRAPTGDRH
jgi:acyl-CoA synthetase (AMP-forming)/AMP-acid ligase II/NADP-dependent 3-hydroxy acid dehydrogenase YdfG